MTLEKLEKEVLKVSKTEGLKPTKLMAGTPENVEKRLELRGQEYDLLLSQEEKKNLVPGGVVEAWDGFEEWYKQNYRLRWKK